MHSNRPTTSPSILGRPPKSLLHPPFLWGLWRALYYILALRAIAGVETNLEASIFRGSGLGVTTKIAPFGQTNLLLFFL
jgi:hypothetical protein